MRDRSWTRPTTSTSAVRRGGLRRRNVAFLRARASRRSARAVEAVVAPSNLAPVLRRGDEGLHQRRAPRPGARASALSGRATPRSSRTAPPRRRRAQPAAESSRPPGGRIRWQRALASRLQSALDSRRCSGDALPRRLDGARASAPKRPSPAPAIRATARRPRRRVARAALRPRKLRAAAPTARLRARRRDRRRRARAATPTSSARSRACSSAGSRRRWRAPGPPPSAPSAGANSRAPRARARRRLRVDTLADLLHGEAERCPRRSATPRASAPPSASTLPPRRRPVARHRRRRRALALRPRDVAALADAMTGGPPRDGRPVEALRAAATAATRRHGLCARSCPTAGRWPASALRTSRPHRADPGTAPR